MDSINYRDKMDEFPKTPTMSSSTTATINSVKFVNAINKTLFKCGNDELRPVMSGMFCGFQMKKFPLLQLTPIN